MIDKERLLYAVEMANIREFIESLPLKYNTKIGNTGQGLSQGQKQRILIARAIYRNPDYLFFDEATNALDTDNEKVIRRAHGRSHKLCRGAPPEHRKECRPDSGTERRGDNGTGHARRTHCPAG